MRVVLIKDWELRCFWEALITFSTVRSNFAIDNGFSIKSNAPRRVASTAVSTVPCPDIITTGHTKLSSSAHSLNKVIPSISGIQISRSIRSGEFCFRNNLASDALEATITS